MCGCGSRRTSSSLSTMYLSPGARPISGQLSSSNSVNLDLSVKEKNDKRLSAVVEWLNSMCPHQKLSSEASEEELRVFLKNGTVFCDILNKISPDSVPEDPGASAGQSLDYVKKFLLVIEDMGLPGFEVSDLEKGSMKAVVECLLILRDDMNATDNHDTKSTTKFKRQLRRLYLSEIINGVRMNRSMQRLNSFPEERSCSSPDTKFQRVLQSPIAAEPPTAMLHHAGQKFHEVFQLKQGRYSDLPAARISEMMKLNSLDNAPTQSLMSVVNGILDESIERKNGEIPQRVACLLRKVVHEIERRISTQAQHIRNQNNLIKAREERYLSRIKVLEALATGTNEESQLIMNQLKQIKNEKARIEDTKKLGEQDFMRLTKEKKNGELAISKLKEEIETTKRTYEERCLQLEKQAEETQLWEHGVFRPAKDKESSDLAILALKEELETTKRTSEERCFQLKKQAEETQLREHDVVRLAKDKESSDLAILALKEELETTKRTYEERCFQLKNQAEETQVREHDVVRLTKDKESSDLAILALKEELQTTKRTYEEHCLQLEKQAKETQLREHDVVRLTKDKESSDLAILALKEELQTTKRTYEERCLQLEKQAEETQLQEHDVVRLMKDKESSDLAILALKEELQTTKRTYEERCLQLEKQAKESKVELEEKLKEVEYLLTELRNRKELEAISASKIQTWNEKERSYQSSIGYHFQMLQELRASSGSIKNEINNAQQIWQEEFSDLWSTLKQMANATENYQIVLSENRKLYNDVQDLKGKIRVYCRIRPFLPGQTGKQSTIDYIGEDGELIVANPSKQGKDGQRMFKFNKVFGPMATQEEVFLDTRPLIRTILDGYNVCIFAYGQTGSGKTYTMTGPETQSKETWGVNYRALNDLFEISQNRSANFRYEVGVQMVEIYNEQVRDLLGNDGSHKRLGICSTSQPNGLAVPDASMHPVNSTTNVLELMQIGHMNRTVGATALNIRSSRSHSVVSVHVRGTNLETGVTLRGSLHLVDLAGSERVDRSEATGERLKEAQHINKSLSALGDVIFALAQKSLHVPYRNSKLTQILQSSLGGQAKTLMFVQLNPDLESYSETLSTLKFAERVSGIELGTSRSNKEGKDVRELMEQVASLKDAITKKDEEIEQLHHLKDPKTQSHNVHSEKRPTSSVRHIASVPNLPSPHGGPPRRSRTQSTGRQASNSDNSSEHSDRQSEASFHHPSDDFKQKKEASGHSKLIGEDTGQNFTADVEIVGLRHTRSDERLSDISVGGISMGAENDGCVEFTIQSEGRNHDEGTQKMTRVSSFPQSPQRSTQTTSTRVSPKVSTKGLTSVRKAVMAHESISSSKASQRWQ